MFDNYGARHHRVLRFPAAARQCAAGDLEDHSFKKIIRRRFDTTPAKNDVI